MRDEDLKKPTIILLRVFIITVVIIVSLAMFYGSIKFISNYFNMSDKQICEYSNSTLVNGQCHYEDNTSVTERRNMLLFGGIMLPIFAILFIVYLIIVLKYQLK